MSFMSSMSSDRLLLLMTICVIIAITFTVLGIAEGFSYYGSIVGAIAMFIIALIAGFIALHASDIYKEKVEVESANQVSDQYESILNRLDDNPFDKDAIYDAIIYNSKIDVAKELDSFDIDGFEEYLNEHRIDINKYQYDYIDEHFDIDKILETRSN